MKATEFRIGDYIMFVHEGVTPQLCRVSCIDETKPNEVWATPQCDPSILLKIGKEDFAPIPLTEEILEKNGWKKQCSNLDMSGWSNNHIKIYPQDKKLGGGFSFFYSGNSVQYVHYLHELQHILWALGLDDNITV